MKKIVLVFSIIITSFLQATGQKALTLGDCYDAALVNHSLKNEKEQLGMILELKDRNTVTGWYPTIETGASFLYNTNVVDLGSALESIPIPGIADNIDAMPHEQYRITLDIQQVIWDGGAINGSRELEKRSQIVKQQEVEIELYRIREQVNNSFFNLIMLDKQQQLLNSYLEIINERIRDTELAIVNELLLPSDRDVLKAEKIRIEQQLAEIKIRRSSLISILSDITGYDIGTGTKFLLPEISTDIPIAIDRPELTAIDLRREQLEAGKALLISNRMPKAYGFATLGFGKPPGNDFFNNSFGPYAVLGAGIKWNIIDWNRSKRDRQVIDINKNILTARKNELEANLKRQLENKQAEIMAFESMLESDRELIKLRKNITLTAESRFRNGTITSTEYMQELNAEKQAALNYEIHYVGYMKSKVEYLNTAGSEIKN